MQIPTAPAGVSTTGLTGITLMILHITGYLTGWAWPFLYIFLILSGVGQENRKIKNGNTWYDRFRNHGRDT